MKLIFICLELEWVAIGPILRPMSRSQDHTIVELGKASFCDFPKALRFALAYNGKQKQFWYFILSCEKLRSFRSLQQLASLTSTGPNVLAAFSTYVHLPVVQTRINFEKGGLSNYR